MERPEEGENEDPFTGPRESEICGAGRGGAHRLDAGRGSDCESEISGSPSPPSAAGAGKFTLGLWEPRPLVSLREGKQ